MSNGARHGLGIVAGVILTPVIAVGLMYGIQRLGVEFSIFRLDFVDTLPAYAVLVVVAVLLGLLAGSRMSPLASLVPGVVYTAIGLLWMLAPRWAFRNSRDLLPRDLERGYGLLGPYGIFLVLGILLLVASLMPSRWRSRPPVAGALSGAGAPGGAAAPPPGFQGSYGRQGLQGPQGPQGPQSAMPGGRPGFGGPPAAYGEQQAQQHAQQPAFGGPPLYQQGQAPGFGQRPPYEQGPSGPAPYAPPPAQQQPAAAPAPPPPQQPQEQPYRQDQPYPQPQAPPQPPAFGQEPAQERPPAFRPPDERPSPAAAPQEGAPARPRDPSDGTEGEPGSWTRIFGEGSEADQGARPGEEPPAPPAPPPPR